MKLTVDQKKFAVQAIQKIARRKDGDGHCRLRNFIIINYRVKYTLRYCKIIWNKYK